MISPRVGAAPAEFPQKRDVLDVSARICAVGRLSWFRKTRVSVSSALVPAAEPTI